MVYDCIVIGVGGVGSAALYAAAKRGWSVLGIDKYGAAHDRGSSHGRTRIIRTAYFEHPNYVPLVRRAWRCWESIQAESNCKLLQKTGLLQIGDPDGELIQSVLRSASDHDLPVQELSASEIVTRFPAFKLPADSIGVFEESAGYLLVEQCVAQTIKLALNLGAEFLSNESVEGISVNANGSIDVRTDANSFQAARLIITTGAWTSSLFSALPLEVEIVMKQQHWFQLDRADIKYQNGFPAFLVENETGCFYGIPEIDYLGIKVAEHSGGVVIEDPEAVERDCDQQELLRSEAFLDSCFNFTRRRLVHHSLCMYSMSRDKHFVVDRHPESPQIAFAAGLSGHGFKFAPLLGERLVGLLENESDAMFDFLKIGNRKLN